MESDKSLNSLVYPGRQDLLFAFGLIREIKYPLQESVPDYSANHVGMEKTLATIEHSKSPYYPSIHEKGAYIFSSIAKGHFFMNGNKRLAMAVTLMFYIYNGFDLAMEKQGRADCVKMLHSTFKLVPVEEIVRLQDEVATLDLSSALLYMLAFVNVESSRFGYSFDELKSATKNFFGQFFKAPTDASSENAVTKT